jgi:hypothetical protein
MESRISPFLTELSVSFSFLISERCLLIGCLKCAHLSGLSAQ